MSNINKEETITVESGNNEEKGNIMSDLLKQNEEKKTELQEKFGAKIEGLRTKSDRDSIVGFKDRKTMRESVGAMIKEAEEAAKKSDKEAEDSKDKDGKLTKEKGELKKELKQLRAIGREFGRFDGAVVVDGVLNIGVTVGGGAILAKLTDGDYVKAILPNVAGCASVDLVASGIEKYLTGQYGEGWKRWTFRGVKFVFRTGGAAGIAGGVSYLLKGDPLEAAITAGGTQVAKIGLESLRDAIMQW